MQQYPTVDIHGRLLLLMDVTKAERIVEHFV